MSNKATDKDTLFSKILPALNDNPFSATYDASSAGVESEKPAPIVSDDSLSVLRNRLFARAPKQSTGGFSTINVMENLVLRNIDTVIEKFNLCRCDRCRCDLAACALNKLPPKYIVADAFRMAQVEEEIATKQVMDALVKGVILVRSNPKH